MDAFLFSTGKQKIVGFVIGLASHLLVTQCFPPHTVLTTFSLDLINFYSLCGVNLMSCSMLRLRKRIGRSDK